MLALFMPSKILSQPILLLKNMYISIFYNLCFSAAKLYHEIGHVNAPLIEQNLETSLESAPEAESPNIRSAQKFQSD